MSAPTVAELIAQIQPLLGEHLDQDFADAVAVAPARVNLIGEHTDYNDGFVFPAAIDRYVVVAAALSKGPSQFYSTLHGSAPSVNLAQVQPGQIDSSLWSKYPAGMAWALRQTQKGMQVPNVRAVVASSIGTSGISSSAALEVAFGLVFAKLSGQPLTNPQIARAGKYCENEFFGLRSGIMDQMASATGKRGMAMLMDTWRLGQGEDASAIEYAPVPEGLALVLCDTGVKHDLATTAYNVRVRECNSAKAVLGLPSWRESNLGQVAEAHSRGLLSDRLERRSRHILSENNRSLAFAAALEQGNTAALFGLMQASHESLAKDYEVSCPELDAMAEAAWGAPGCVGARMTGGGFGGACIALVERSRVEAFSISVLAQYGRSYPQKGSVLVCQAVDGARLIS